MTSDRPAASKQSGSIGFRPDIQGLRALAVVLVIIAHAGVQRFAGGFVGVDVFFVISGFLIIGLLFGEAEKTSRISILGFYARRARRVIPAATVVLAVTAVAAAYVLPFVRGYEVIKDTVWAAFFGANIRFSLVETDYFSAGEPPSPVQHYWSLSVEEQFYVVIPLLLMLIAFAVRRWTVASEEPAARAVFLRRWVMLVLGAVTLVSLAWSVYLTNANPTAAYFSTLARAWELGAGGLLALLVWGRRIHVARWTADLLAATGLVFIAWATLTFSAKTEFPGTAALVPVLGSALLLAAGSTTGSPASLIGRALSLKPVQLVGDWSYSLYLWHFPVLRLAIAEWGPLDRLQTVLAVAATFVLAAATYYGIEQPFRKGVHWRSVGRAVALYPASLALVIVSALTAHTWVDRQLAALEDNPAIAIADYQKDNLSEDPAVALVEASVQAAEEGRPVPGGLQPGLDVVRDSIAPLGDCDYRTGTTKLCPFGDPDADRSIVVMGDSHGRAWGPAFDRIGELYGYAVYQFVYSGCPANQATRADPEGGARWTACEQFNDWALDQVEELQPAMVAISNNGYSRGSFNDVQLEGLEGEFRLLKGIVDNVAFVGNTPRLSEMPGVCLSSRGVDLGDCLLGLNKGQMRQQRDFRELARAEGVEFVNALPWFCDKGRCPSVIGNNIPMRDKDHVTTPYAEQLAEPLARRLELDR